MIRSQPLKTGDIFSVQTGENKLKYFQFIAEDLTQLSSQVIRVFRKEYAESDQPDLHDIIRDGIDFYAHVFLKNGIKLGYWQRVGTFPDIGRTDVFFRNTNDYGKPQVKVSNDWHVWRINEPFVSVGKLEGKNRKAEIGVVVAPDSIVHRMRTGRYDFLYPGFE